MRVRLPILLTVAAGLVALLVASRAMQMPSPAPLEVQRAGLEKVRRVLREIEASEFGRTERGQILTRQISSAMSASRISFTTDIGGRAAHLSNIFGRDRWYIMVLEMNHGRFLHQAPWQLAEVIYHEAVHATSGSGGHGSFEEECDAFAAGLQAEHVMRGAPHPVPLIMDGMPIARFVQEKYPQLASDPAYQPVGTSTAWLDSMTRPAPSAHARLDAQDTHHAHESASP